MNYRIGKAIRDMRHLYGLSLREAGDELGVSDVHLCNVEMGHSSAGPRLLAAIRKTWEFDPYVFAWLSDGDENRLPPKLRKSALELTRMWWEELKRRIKR